MNEIFIWNFNSEFSGQWQKKMFAGRAVKNICQHQKRRKKDPFVLRYIQKKRTACSTLSHIGDTAMSLCVHFKFNSSGPNFNGTNQHWIDSFILQRPLCICNVCVCVYISLCCLVSFFAHAHAKRFSSVFLFHVILLCDACAYNADFANRIQSVVELPCHGKIHILFYYVEENCLCWRQWIDRKEKSRSYAVHMNETNGIVLVPVLFCLFVCWFFFFRLLPKPPPQRPLPLLFIIIFNRLTEHILKCETWSHTHTVRICNISNVNVCGKFFVHSKSN